MNTKKETETFPVTTGNLEPQNLTPASGVADGRATASGAPGVGIKEPPTPAELLSRAQAFPKREPKCPQYSKLCRYSETLRLLSRRGYSCGNIASFFNRHLGDGSASPQSVSRALFYLKADRAFQAEKRRIAK